jgi:branched-chain amino acid transport system permease protein
MLYREAGQYKTTYRADQGVFPILQDKVFIIALVLIAYLVVPFVADSFWYQVILLPVMIFSLAALGLNVLTGYTGQISLGSGAFMAVGAYSAFKISAAFPELNIILVFLLSGLFAAVAGVFFGLPSLRVKGFYLAVATLAAQFFFEWLFVTHGWFHNYDSASTIAGPLRTLFGFQITGPGTSPEAKYLTVLTFLVVFCILVKNLVRGRVGRAWMAIRDFDVAAELIGIRPLRTKLLAFAVSSYILGVAGGLYAFILLGSTDIEGFEILVLSFPLLFMVVIGGLGSIMGSIMGATFITLVPIIIESIPETIGLKVASYEVVHISFMILGATIIGFLIVEPNGLARLWQIAKEKLRLWPFPH